MDPLTFAGAVVTFLFLLVVLSYYALLFIPRRPKLDGKRFRSLTVIVPAHNEERYIDECLHHVLAATFKGKKDVIVVDDGSDDRTASIARRRGVTVLRKRRGGKSAAINEALSRTRSELVAIVDADSLIAPDAFERAIPYLAAKEVAVVCATIKVRNRKSFIGMWLHIEQLYNSLIRELFTKVNVNIVTPGPLSIYKRAALDNVGGFNTRGYSEDVDIAVRLLKAGYRAEYAPRSVSETYMPITVKGFFRQRTRFAKGWINILKRHLRLNRTLVEIYTLPLALFWYIQAVIMGTVTLVSIGSGYLQYFASQHIFLSWGVAKYLFEWLSIVGVVRWIVSLVTGATPLTIAAAISVAATLLTYPLYLYAILRFDRKLDVWHLIPLFLMFPFWLVLMAVYIIELPECFNAHQPNQWEK